jgi:hypothetical protein
MYKIIGGDQKEYGPVTADELRRWIAEGRLNGQSQVRLEGQTDWLPLSSFPEFADALAAQVAPTYASVSGGAAPPIPLSPDEILAREPSIDIGDCLGRSWRLFTSNFSLLFCASFLAWLILLVQFIPFVGGLLLLLGYGILFGGLYLVFLNRIRSRAASVTDVFSGFSVSPAQLMLVGFLTALLTKIGMCCCLIPGIYLQVAWAFAVALVADKRLEFWAAMELSRKVVTRAWFRIFALLLVGFLPYILCYVVVEIILMLRIFPTVQEMVNSGQPDYQRMSLAMRDIVKSSFPLVILLKFAMLLNLPFAVGALMYAYESLFGPRPAQTT